MSKIVESKTFVDGEKRITADVRDDGIVVFTIADHAHGHVVSGGLGAAVLEDLALVARSRKV